VSRPLRSYFYTPVSNVILLNPNLLNTSYGAPFLFTPMVKVVDENNDPIPNKRVIAISWTEYDLGIDNGWELNLQGN